MLGRDHHEGGGRAASSETRIAPKASYRAPDAKPLLFAAAFDTDLVSAARRRSDVELIDLDRLHRGS